jgi:hypothetical protein
VSVEVDNVKDRFRYVKEGIQYLKDGIDFNRENATLLDDLGWFTGNKVGRADEHTIYRQLFKLDDDLHHKDDPSTRDNWLVSKRWYERAVRAIDEGGQPLGTKNPTTFFDSPARSQISYAEAIETEGVFGQQAQRAWQEGGRLWTAYGEREMPSTEEFLIRLVDQQKWEDAAKKLRSDLDALSPGLEAKMKEEAQASLTPDQRRLWEQSPTSPTAEESKILMEASDAMDITVDEIASRVAKDAPDKAVEARRVATEIRAAERRAALIETNRDVANFQYWQTRCKLEQTSEALEARRLAHDAKRLFEEEGNLMGSKNLYERSFDAWAKALEQTPEMPLDSTTGSDLTDVVIEYVKVLEQLELSLGDEEIANKFPLWDLLEANNTQRKFTSALETNSARRAGRPLPQPDSGSKALINPADAIPR